MTNRRSAKTHTDKTEIKYVYVNHETATVHSMYSGQQMADNMKTNAIAFATWIQKNCIVSRNGFRLLPLIKEEISNEKAYELYLESLKSK